MEGEQENDPMVPSASAVAVLLLSNNRPDPQQKKLNYSSARLKMATQLAFPWLVASIHSLPPDDLRNIPRNSRRVDRLAFPSRKTDTVPAPQGLMCQSNRGKRVGGSD
eukprot:1576952-Amphidinium_carterae.1